MAEAFETGRLKVLTRNGWHGCQLSLCSVSLTSPRPENHTYAVDRAGMVEHISFLEANPNGQNQLGFRYKRTVEEIAADHAFNPMAPVSNTLPTF